MRKEYLLLTPSSDDEKKSFRTELKRCNIKVKENFDKFLTKYYLTEDEVNSLNLNVVKVFRNMLRENKSLGVAMVSSQNPISYNRHFYFTEVNYEMYNCYTYRDYAFTYEVENDLKSFHAISIYDLIDKIILDGSYSYIVDNLYKYEFIPEKINNTNTITVQHTKLDV